MWEILQNNINARITCVTYSYYNFVTLPGSARELSLAVENDKELNNLLSYVTTA